MLSTNLLKGLNEREFGRDFDDHNTYSFLINLIKGETTGCI